MSRLPLYDLQRLVVDGLLRATPVESDVKLAASVGALLVPSRRGMSSAARLEVYREQFWLRHVASLGEDFPTLEWALGGSAPFRELAVSYLRAQPPSIWDLQKLGAGVQTFLQTQAPWAKDILAQDSARIDWAFMEAFDAPDAPVLDVLALANAPPEALPNAMIAFHPSMRIVVTDHPVHGVRDAVMSGLETVRPAPQKTHAVVWRDVACFLRVARVEPAAADLMLALAGGVPLGQACAAVAKTHFDDGSDVLEASVAAWFQFWAQSGLLTSATL